MFVAPVGIKGRQTDEALSLVMETATVPSFFPCVSYYFVQYVQRRAGRIVTTDGGRQATGSSQTSSSAEDLLYAIIIIIPFHHDFHVRWGIDLGYLPTRLQSKHSLTKPCLRLQGVLVGSGHALTCERDVAVER